MSLIQLKSKNESAEGSTRHDAFKRRHRVTDTDQN